MPGAQRSCSKKRRAALYSHVLQSRCVGVMHSIPRSLANGSAARKAGCAAHKQDTRKNVERTASRILWPSPQPTPSPPNYPPYVVAAAAAALAVISRYHVVMEVGGVESPWAAQGERAHHRRVSTGFVYCVLAEEERALAQREQTHSTRPLCVFEAKRTLRRRHPSAT